MALLGLGNGTMYGGSGGYTNKFRQAACMGVPNGVTNTLQPSVAGGNSVFNGFAFLTWCKTIFAIYFPFFDKSMGTPYSGQLYPTGTSVGASGQVFPTRG